MKSLLLIFTAAVALCFPASGQNFRRIVRTTGTASVPVRPDLAKIDVGVTTQAATAQEATSQNATQVDQVLAALRQLLGAQADIKTTVYAVSPVYRFPTGGPQQLVGWQVVNTMQVTVENISMAGRVIDAAVAAGATTISRLQFTIKDEIPARTQALKLAAQQAKTKAEAIASGLNLRIGNVTAVEEGGASPIQPLTRTDLTAASASTPIESGTLDVRAFITLEVELTN